MKESKRYYVAYGSNMNIGQMERRCPTATVVGATKLQDFRLRFRGPATVEPCQGESVPVLVWELLPEDEFSLDIYEGYPDLYRKEFVKIKVGRKNLTAMIYIMNERCHPYCMPSYSYLHTICEGYESAGFDTELLSQAVRNNQQ